MSFVLSIPVAMCFMCAGAALGMPEERILFMLAIIFAGGLAGCHD
jgi:hypothetical protein